MVLGKRSHDELEEAHSPFAKGEMLSKLQGDSEPASKEEAADHDGEWQVAESHHSKKRKKLSKKGDSYPSITHSPSNRLQSYVKLGDLQNLVLYLLADGTSPQWCAVRHHQSVRKVVVLMAPGLEQGMFDGTLPLSPSTGEIGAETALNGFQEPHQRNTYRDPDAFYPKKLRRERLPEALQPLADVFEHVWPVRTPGDDKYAKMHSPLAAMLTAPIVKPKDEKTGRGKGSGPRPPTVGRDWQNKRTPVSELLATVQELEDAGYVLHPVHCAETKDALSNAVKEGWVHTGGLLNIEAGNTRNNEAGSITEGRKVLALDCEMCITSPTGVTPQVFSLTRISVIDWDGNTVMDEFVRPENPITDYLTPYSGITAQKLEGVTTTLSDIQRRLVDDILTPQTILVGHSLEGDLKALQLTHPFIIDTTFLFPHPRGPPLKSSLKWLSQKYLQREIQKGHGSTGHNSIEDAKACLDLVKQKCEKGKLWGTPEATSEPIFKRLARQSRPKKDKANPAGDEEERISAVVDFGDPTRGYGGGAKVAIGCESDAEVVAGIKQALEGDKITVRNGDAAEKTPVPAGGCDFVWARLRELEAYRGWWSHSKLVDSDQLRSSTTASSAANSLEAMVAQTTKHITDVYESLPACTALIVYSGSGDPTELREMQCLQAKFKEEYKVKKWDELSVRWTDDEEQKLRRSCEKARLGVGLVAVK